MTKYESPPPMEDDLKNKTSVCYTMYVTMDGISPAASACKLQLCESVVNFIAFTVISLLSVSSYNLSNTKLQQMHDHMSNRLCLRNIYPFNPHHRNVPNFLS